MVTEIAVITTKPEDAGRMEEIVRNAGLALLKSAVGAISVRFGRGVEMPNRFSFVIEWESVEAHAAANREADMKAFLASMVSVMETGWMEHFEFV